MPKTITQRVALEGGPQFRAGLEELGKAGQEAFAKLREGANETTSLAARLAPSIAALQGSFARLGEAGRNVATHFRSTATSFESSARRLALFAGAIVGANGGLVALAVNAGKATEAIEKGAAAAGLNTDDYQNLKTALGFVGVESEEVSQLFNKMNRSFGEQRTKALELKKAQRDLTDQFVKGKISAEDYNDQLVKGQKALAEDVNAFNRLGITASTAFDSPREALLQLADAFSKLPPGIEKNSLEMEILSKKGTAFALALNQGRKGLLELEAEAKRVAPPLNKLELQIGGKLKDAFEKLTAAANNTRLRFQLIFAGTFAGLFNTVTEAIIRNRDAFFELGRAVLTALQPVIAVTVDWINSLTLDPAAIDGIVQTLSSFARDLTTAIGIIIAAWNGLVTILDNVAGIINSIFGTEITGRALAIVAVLGILTGGFSALLSVIGLVGSLIGFLVAAFGGLNVAIAAAAFALGFFLGKELLALIDALPELFQKLVNRIVQIWNDLPSIMKQVWTDIVDFLTQKWDDFINFFINAFDRIKDKLKKLNPFASGDNSNPEGGGGTGLAGGGMVRGPGTSTSDSIRAWLSDGEFVVKARAVKHYGSAFLYALNNMKFPRTPGFNMGGLVSAIESISPRTHFATGGLVEASATSAPTGRPVILKIGENTFGPMIAGEKTITQLERFVSSKQMRSAGRKPTWA